MAESKHPDAAAIPWWRRPKPRSYMFQAAVVAATFYALYVLTSNIIANLRERSIKTSFDFLNETATFAIPLNFFPFWDFTLGESVYWDVFIIGIQNTMLVMLLGIPSATILGLVLGVTRLSPNFLLRNIALGFVEIFRNTPLLLQLLFWHFAFFPPIYNSLPAVRESILMGGAVFNSAGIYLPSPVLTSAAGWALAATLLLAATGIWWLRRYSHLRRMATGHGLPVFSYGLGILVAALAVFAWIFSDQITVDLPAKRGLNYSGGMRPTKEIISLWFGLTIYTAVYISENVRGGILSVSPGQSEAGMALGLGRIMRMKLVVLPQALRVIIPPTISQYLNLTKNSSLAVAVGYPDITNIWLGIALNQTGQALIIVFMTIVVYETINALTSLATNLYNRSVQIKER